MVKEQFLKGQNKRLHNSRHNNKVMISEDFSNAKNLFLKMTLVESKFKLDDPPVNIYNQVKNDFIRVAFNPGTASRILVVI